MIYLQCLLCNQKYFKHIETNNLKLNGPQGEPKADYHKIIKNFNFKL